MWTERNGLVSCRSGRSFRIENDVDQRGLVRCGRARSPLDFIYLIWTGIDQISKLAVCSVGDPRPDSEDLSTKSGEEVFSD